MINVVVWSHNTIEIESTLHTIVDQDDMIALLKDLLNKVHYSGETICLEKGTIGDGKALFQEIERWK